MSASARILVATTTVGDADLVKRLLRDEFNNVVASTDPKRAVQDFEQHRPEVLILAFDSLESCERYYLGLYRLGTVVHALAHRTLILCNKDDLQRVYELCKKEYFDDYVLFWPLTHDAPRLAMAVHHALRSLGAGTASAPSASEFAAQARQLAALNSQLEGYVAEHGARADAAGGSIRHARQEIGLALDGFSRELSLGGLVEVRDAPGFQREIERLKSEQIGRRLDAVAVSVQPVRAWANELKRSLAPQVESARALQALADRVRPLVLHVDDDDYQHRLVSQLLRETPIELVFAASATAALVALRKRRPDLILMDLELPDIDGIEATRRIKAVEQFARIPILVVTGHSDKDLVVRSARAGAAGFIVKPFAKELLLAKIQSCLAG